MRCRVYVSELGLGVESLCHWSSCYSIVHDPYTYMCNLGANVKLYGLYVLCVVFFLEHFSVNYVQQNSTA